MDRDRMQQSAGAPFFDESGAFSPAAVFSTLASTFCCQTDADFSLDERGTDFSALLGYSVQDLQERFQGHLSQLIPAEHRQEHLRSVTQQLRAGDQLDLVCPLLRKDGTTIWALLKGRLITDEKGCRRLCGIATDITRAEAAYSDLRKKLDQLNIILAQTENIIFEWDLPTDSIFFSETWEGIFGYKPITEPFSKSVLAFTTHLHPDDVPNLFDHLQILKNGANYQAIEARIARADGQYLWCRFRATAIRDENGQVCKLVGIIINIDAEKRETSALKKQAERDSLTKLLNKQTAHERVTQYLKSSPDGVHCVLMIIDVDHFKHVNDQYGHMVGDSVLTRCAQEIKRLFRPVDIVARIGGDEFLVLMKDTSDRELVKARCDQLIAAFRSILQPYVQAHTLSCSIGAAFAPDHGTGYYELFVAADRALYHAKGLGKNQYTFFDGDIADGPSHQFPSAVNAQIDSNDYSDPWADA